MIKLNNKTSGYDMGDKYEVKLYILGKTSFKGILQREVVYYDLTNS